MKKTLTLLVFGLATVFALNVQAQESSSWSTGVDLVSNYIWRGSKFGTGPAMQPSVEFGSGGFAIGAWGSYAFTDNEAAEADLYASYSFTLSEKSSLTFTLTDYYFPGSTSVPSDYFNGESHNFEPMVGLTLGNLSLTGAYMTNKSGMMDISDTYLEAGYSAGKVNLTVGAGNGQYTTDGDFNLCNIGISTSKEIKITDTFSFPVTGSVILNPSSEQLYVVVGISL